MMSPIRITEVEFALFQDFIHEKFGISFPDTKQGFLGMKLHPRLVSLGFCSFSEYIRHVKYGLGKEKEQQRMMSLLTNNETYFFRDEARLQAFKNIVLPELWKQKCQKGDSRIRILSAGCSTGEEAYTLAILAFESGHFFGNWDVKVLGMDVSDRALSVARKGCYSKRAFQSTPEDYFRRFFSQNGKGTLVNESITKMTNFVWGNIVSPETWAGIEPMDVIFCRNVLIYFSQEKLKAAVENLYRKLNKGGILILGHSESLAGVTDRFEPVRLPRAIIYRRVD